MRTIAIMNQKGGSGKTTTSVNLAAALAEKNKKVLVIDLDPQVSTTAWLGCPKDMPGLLEVLTTKATIEEVVVPTTIDGVELVAGSQWLINIEKKLAGEVGAETILKHKFMKLSPARWDYVIIDCPPALSLLTVNALSAVEEVIVPVESRIMALQGLVQLLQTVDIIKDRLNENLSVTGIIACRLDVRTKHSKEVALELRKNFGHLVYSTAIRENIRLSECPSFQQSILQYAPDSSGARDYRAFAKEVIAQEPPVTSSRAGKKTVKSQRINV